MFLTPAHCLVVLPPPEMKLQRPCGRLRVASLDSAKLKLTLYPAGCKHGAKFHALSKSAPFLVK